MEEVAEILLQLAIILILAKAGGEFFERILHLPAVLGELGIGILISPFALGSLSLFGLDPLFTLPHDTGHGGEILPVSSELFFVSQIGAVVLLFEAGLETDRALFVRYIRPALVVASGGALVPFILGVVITVAFGLASFDSVQASLPALFVGAAMMATSVGITARVLSEMRKLDSPESVTVLAAAVVDDVLGIIVLAVITGISQEGTVTLGGIGIIFAKAVGFWLGLTIIGSLIAPYLSRFLIRFRSSGAYTGLSIGIALAAAAIAESYFGLAMIIGSYSLGLALSATVLKERIEEPVRHVSWFAAPLFFAIVGMQVDFTAIAGGSVSVATAVSFAIVISIAGILSKLLGCGLPALAMGFNRRGASRIAAGMLPRGEVALIVAGIGLSSGVIGRSEFGFVIIMTVVTTVLAPVLLTRVFRGGSGLRAKTQSQSVSTE